MLYSIDKNYTCSSLEDAYSLVNIISLVKVILKNFEFSFIVAVTIYSARTDVAYLSLST